MDVTRYSFQVQKICHQALRLAKSLGHQFVEVEHLAFCLLRERADVVPGIVVREQLKTQLQKYLQKQPRIYGQHKLGFGSRLDVVFDEVEANAKDSIPIDESTIWPILLKQSTVLKNYLLGASESGVKLDQGFGQPAFETFESPQVKKTTPSKNDTKQKNSQNKNEEKTKEISQALLKYTVDITSAAERGELDPVVGRDKEVRRILEIVGRKKKNNPILIGEPGVGKTAVVEALALRIYQQQVPEALKAVRILSLDLASLLAGTKYRGEFETRLKEFIEAIGKLNGQVILFIDEIHMIVGAGNPEGGTDAANLLKPALARGEIRCIGATTLDEYRKHIEKDAALERRFQPVQVDEPSREATISILRGIKSRYEVHHGVQIDDEAIIGAVDLSIRYIPARTLPDKAIDLLDEACSRLKIEVTSMPRALDELKTRIESLEIERQAIPRHEKTTRALAVIDVKLSHTKKEFEAMQLVWNEHQSILNSLTQSEHRRQELQDLFVSSRQNGDYDLAAKIQYSERPRVEADVKVFREKLQDLQKLHHFLKQQVTRREIAEVVSQWTGVPVDKMFKHDSTRLLGMEERLRQRVFGQDDAIKVVSKAVRRSRAGIGEQGKPIGVFLFLGPTGVGKTETAKALAEELFEDENKIVRIDMSEYGQEHSVARLVGAPPGYVGFGEAGELTEAVRRKPYSVVLFDEMEKSHPRVLDILLQVLDEGRLTDSRGALVDFTNTLIIMTSNIKLSPKLAFDALERDRSIRASLTEVLRPEFVNRIDDVIEFQGLGMKQFEMLLDKQLKILNERLAERGMRLHLGAFLRRYLISSATDSRFGGRSLKRAFQVLVLDAVSERIIEAPELAVGVWTLDCDEIGSIMWQETADGELLLLPAASSL